MSNTELHHLLNRAIDGVVLHGESDRLRELVRGLEERAEKAEDEREQLRTIARAHWDATERVRALHERRDNGAGPYCYLCADSGDMDWPCATIRAFDEQQPTTTP